MSTAPEASQAELDARMLAELRAFAAMRRHAPTISLTQEEIAMIFRLADERDALRREACGMPDDAVPAPKLVTHVPEYVVSYCDCTHIRRIFLRKSDGHRVCASCHRQLVAGGTLPFCNCGSVDKYGDDLGEHGPRCPYHLAVLRLSSWMSTRELDELCARTLRAMANA